jgi:hypothetical protein
MTAVRGTNAERRLHRTHGMHDRAAPHRYVRRFAELSLLVALGCGDSANSGSSSAEAIEKRNAMCDERERAISDWLSEYRSCETDSDCELRENNYGACVAEFLCGFALNVSVDREGSAEKHGRRSPSTKTTAVAPSRTAAGSWGHTAHPRPSSARGHSLFPERKPSSSSANPKRTRSVQQVAASGAETAATRDR